MKTSIENFFRLHKVHLICWSCFMAYEIMVVGVLNGSFNSFWDYAVHYAINIALFYFHATIVLPFVLQKNSARYWLIPFLITGEITAYILINYTAEHFLVEYLNVKLMRPLILDYHYFIRSTWRAIYFVGFATGYYFLMTTLQERQRAEHAEKQQLLNLIETQNLRNELIKSQNAFLKAQINPHFLFNTLNFVYNHVRKTSGQAAEAILSLSQMMRYALQSEHEHDEANLLEEVEQVENLIHLHQLRQNNKLQVRLTYGDNLTGVKIIPLILLTLVENIFKHGDLTWADKPAQVAIAYELDTLSITTANLALPDRPSGHRIGLDNIQSRLQQAYKQRAAFQAFTDDRGYFHTSISITAPLDMLPSHQHDAASCSISGATLH